MKTAALLLLSGWTLAGQISREGAYFVQTFAGSEAFGASRLRVQARGPVTLVGGLQTDVAYSLKVRVRARHEAEARRMLEAFSVRVTRVGDQAVVTSQRGPGVGELHVKAPRALREAQINTTEGGITIFDLDGSVRADTGGGPIRADRVRGEIELHTAGGDIDLGEIEGPARAITAGGPITARRIGGDALLETAGGDITAQEVGGQARASTAAGAVRIARSGGAVVVATGGGAIEVGEARGMVTIRNSGGPVHVGAAHGVRCETAAGGIRLSNVTGSLRASTAMGSIIAELLAARPLADSFLTTGSGDITVMIPSNLAVRIRAENQLADSIRRIISEFPGIEVRVRGGQVVAEGDINGGGPLLYISGTGGRIFIKRQQYWKGIDHENIP